MGKNEEEEKKENRIETFGAFIFVMLIFLIYAGPTLFSYLGNTSLLESSDGISHYSMVKVFAEQIFPEPFGWIHNWYSGMPWPIGYPPLFYYFASVWGYFSPFGLLIDYRIMIVVATLLYPLFFFLIAKQLKLKNLDAFVATLVANFVILSPSNIIYVITGFTLTSTFDIGLHPQTVAGAILFGWVAFLLREKHSKYDFLINTITLAVLMLINIHVAEAGFVLLFFKLLVEIKKDIITNIFKHSLSFILPFFLNGFWIVPLLTNLDFFPSKVVDSYPLLSIFPYPFLPIIFLSLLSIVFIIKNKNKNYLFIYLSFITFFLLSILPLNKIVSGIPIHPQRLFTIALLLSVFPAIYAIKEIVREISHLKGNLTIKILIYLSFLIPMFLLIHPHFVTSKNFLKTPNEGLTDVVEFLQDKEDGRSMIEIYRVLDSNETAINAFSTYDSKHLSSFVVFRESSLNSHFLLPIINSFSRDHEVFGIDCFLCNSEFYNREVDIQLQRLKEYNIRYIVIKTPDIQKQIIKMKEFNKVYESGEYIVFKTVEFSPFAETLDQEPVLTFTDIKSKGRKQFGPDSLEWLRFNEEWLHRGNDNKLIKSNDVYFDTSDEIDDYIYIILEDFKYTSLENLKDRLEELAPHKVIFYIKTSNSDPEVTEIFDSIDNQNILTVDGNRSIEDVINIIDGTMDFGFVDRSFDESRPISVTFHDNRIILNSSTIIKKGEFVYLKSSYFPYWKSIDAEVFMSSPANIVVRANEDTNTIVLEMDYYNDFQNGFKISFGAALIIIILQILFLFRNREILNFKNIQ